MQGFGDRGRAPRWRVAVRRLAVLLLLLLAQLVLAGEALATNWVVNITDSEDPIPLGGTVTYTITVENEDLATNTAPQNTLDLTIPTSFTFTGTEAGSPITGCAPQPATGPATVSCTLPPMAGGDVYTLKAQVKTSTQGTFIVDAKVPTLGIDTEPANNIASQPTTVTDGTDLTLDVTGPASSAAGSQVTYDFTVNNLGPMPATNVVVSVPVPAGLEDLVWPAGCVLSGANYLCTIPGPVAVGANASLQLKGQVAVASTSTITVTGEITSSNPPDRITSNNRDTTTTNVTAGSDVKIAKSRSPSTGTLLVGNDVTFTLTPRFTGETPLGLTIVDDLPGVYQINSVTPSAGSGWTCDVAGQTVTCTLPSGGAPGHNVPLGPITIETTVVGAGNATNTATISSTSPLDPDLSNNTASDGGAAINDKTADLRANKSASPAVVLEGLPFNFIISTTNLGNQPFSGTVEMTDSLPAGLTVQGFALAGWTCPSAPVVGPATITCSRTYTDAAPLPVGATTPSVTLQTVSTVSGAVTLSNAMTVSTVNPNFPDPNLKNNTVTTGVNSTGSGNQADIRVLKQALNKTIASGATEQFLIDVINDGSGTSSSVTLTDDLTGLINNQSGAANGLVQVVWAPNSASGMNCSTAPVGGATGTTVRLTCTITSLPVCTAGVNCPQVNVVVRPGGNAGTRTNSATARSSVTFDPNLANNTGSDTFAVTALADVTIAKTVNPSDPRAGQAFTYVLTATTTPDGRSAAENVTVTDTLPPGLIFLNAVPSTGSCSKLPTAGRIVDDPLPERSTPGLLECNLGTIGNGVQQTVTVTVAATTALANTTVTNVATVTSPTTPGDDGGNNTASVDANIRPPTLDLQINKVDTPTPDYGPDPVGIGADMVYGLIVNNNGPSAAQDVVVTDTLPASFLTYQSVSAPAGVTCTGPAVGSLGGTLTCNIPLMLSGASRIIKVTMNGAARGVAVNAAALSSPEITNGWDTNPANDSDSESTTVRSRPDVELVSKIPSANPVTLLQPFNFAITVRNNTGPGLFEADQTVLSDTLPAGMKLAGTPSAVVVAGTTTSSICSGSAGAGAFTCEFGTMGVGAEVVVTVPVQVIESSGLQQVFTNTASVATTSLEENTANNTNSGQVTVEAASLAGLVFRDFNNNGVQDPGDTGIGGVAMTVAGTGPGGTPVNLTVTTAADGTYLFPAVAPGSFTVTRGAVGDPSLTDGIAEPGSAGGTALGATAIGGVVLTNQAATGYDFTLVPTSGIAITKALLSGPTANADGTFDAGFRLTVSNPSAEPLQDISVTDPLAGPAPLFGSFAPALAAPGTYAVIAAPSGSCGGLNGGFNGSSDAKAAQGASLAVGASCTIDFTLRVRPTDPLPPFANGGRYVNQASVTGTGSLSGQTLTQPSNPVPVSPQLPRLTIAKALTGYTDVDNSGSVTLNDILNFQSTASNVGSAVLTNVVVSDKLVTPDSKTCAVLQPGETCVLTGTHTVTLADVQAGAVVNTATAKSDQTDPVTATVTTPVVAVSGIAISKALLSGPTANTDGSFDVSFRLTVVNPSSDALKDVLVTDPLAGPAPLFGSFAVGAGSPGTYMITGPPTGTCGGLNAAFNGDADAIAAQGGTLAVGASCTIDFSLKVRPTVPLPPEVNGGRYFNQAAVSGTGEQSGTGVTGTSDLVPVSPALPILGITKELTGYTDVDRSGSISLNDILNFKVTASNTGSMTLTDVVVGDPILTPASKTCPVLQQGESCILTGTYTVTIEDVQTGQIVNTATADSTETNPVTGPVTAEVTTPVVAVAGGATITKTALITTAKRGEKVPYVIVAQEVPFNPARIVDVMPPGFNYVAGSAIANGKKVVPVIDGRNLTFNDLVPDKKGSIKLELVLVVSASVNPGVSVNQAQLVDPRSGQVVATDKARVTILAEAVFDCGDIIGKVFDDKNRNGYQDEGEPGLAAVRVATVRGLLVTSDANGRFNIPCADIPDADIGSNFVLKLDTRTLPTGYHLTTENPRRVRLTRGKVVKLNFGASLSRLVKLELNGRVFEQGSTTLLPKWQSGLDRLVTALEAETSVLEITYRGSEGALAKARLRKVKDEITQRWQAVPGHYDLAIDTRILSGGSP